MENLLLLSLSPGWEFCTGTDEGRSHSRSTVSLHGSLRPFPVLSLLSFFFYLFAPSCPSSLIGGGHGFYPIKQQLLCL